MSNGRMRRVLTCLAVSVVSSSVLTAMVVVDDAPAGAGSVAAESKAPSASATALEKVIVLLRDQLPALPDTPADTSRRAALIRSGQAEALGRARQLGATDVRQFSVVNAMALSLPAERITALSADPAVRAVVPDLTVRTTAQPIHPSPSATRSSMPLASACPSGHSVMLEPEALQTMNVTGPDGHGGANRITTGTGVTVAYLADGLDPNNPDFIRNGTSIFADYRDFTGTGPGTPDTFDEGYGDASAIAAQGNAVYDVGSFVNPAHALTAPCRIRIRGVAPGVTMVGMKVGNGGSESTSDIIQGLDWAINVDHADVVNESVGSDPYPDTAVDPLREANAQATAAGVTVVVAAGDSGPTNVIWSPASADDVIAVGASTTFRIYAQTTLATNLPGITGWADDNISAISSSGFAQDGRVIDVVAPGEENWSLCTPDPVLFTDCVDDAGRPSAIQDFGGTSQSAPFVSGVAALVIAAYEKAHPGAGRPSPALVKRLITSTARDLGHPAELQGAGEVDALAAVRAATAVPAEATAKQDSSRSVSNALLLSRTQLDLSGPAGSIVSSSVEVTNLSSSRQRIAASTAQLGARTPIAKGALDFDTAKLPNFTFAYGDTRAYEAVPFSVPRGRDRLSVSYTYRGGSTRIQAVLVDPHGTLQAFSLTQGPSNYGRLDSRYPRAGTWTLYLFSILPLSTTVHYAINTENYGANGTVTPASQSIAPGATTTVGFSVRLPAVPGDSAVAVHLVGARGTRVSLPVSLRATVAMQPGTTSFRGAVTGGNGYLGAAETNAYYIDVPEGLPNLNATVYFDRRSADNVYFVGYLVGPDGQALAENGSASVRKGDLYSYQGVQVAVPTPAPGRWTLILVTYYPAAGNAVREPFTAYLSSSPDTSVTADGLPNSSDIVVPGGQSTAVTLHVTNHSRIPQTYFADPRANALTWYQLASRSPGDNLRAVNLLDEGFYAQWIVPDHSDTVAFSGQATNPILIEALYGAGDPDILGGPSNDAVVSFGADQVAPGLWYSQAQLVGPFATPAPAQTVRLDAEAHTLAFDTTMFSSTGDYWRRALIPAPAHDSSGTPNALVLDTQSSGVITLSLEPSAADKGKVVSGTVYIDTVDNLNDKANQIVALPYRYTVG